MKIWVCLFTSLTLNLFLVNQLLVSTNKNHGKLLVSSNNVNGWSKKAAEEAEFVASFECSGHGRVYLDGILSTDDHQNNIPRCECNSCYYGSDCSQFNPDCPTNADGGDPLFLEPFWMGHAASSALVVSGWHRMSYSFEDGSSVISKELEMHIRKLHEMVGNADTTDRYIVFGAGSTQLIVGALYSLFPLNSTSPSRVVAATPYYQLYNLQTNLFNSVNFTWKGDAFLWKNRSDASTSFIEFVTSPNNPDGKLKKPVLEGPFVNTIYDRAYYWPHYTAIPAPANDDLMIFTLSKITGHAGSRFGWALIKDRRVYERLTKFMTMNSMGVSRDTQLRALKLLKVVLSKGKEFFEFGHEETADRWKRLNQVMSMSSRFSLQKIAPQYCTYFQNVTSPSPGYAWVKCEREEDKDCFGVLRSGGIIGRMGSLFGSEDRYVRLSLIRRQDDFELLIKRLKVLVSQERGDTADII